MEAAEYDDYDDYDDARAGGVLLDVEIDKRQGLGGSVHTIQLEARLEEDVPAMSPATSDLGRPRDNAKRLSGTWDDDLHDRAGLCGNQIFNPTSMCVYATVSTRDFLLCFENSMRAIDSSKNQPNRLRFDRDKEF